MDTNGLNYFLRNGFILGLIQSAMQICFYLFNPALFGSLWIGPLIIFAIIALSFVFTVHFRKINGGYVSFKDAFWGNFFLLVIRSLMVTITTVLLFNFIDPTLEDVMIAALIENLNRFSAGVPDPQGQLEKSIQMIEAQRGGFGVMKQISGFIFTNVIAAGFSAVVALILRKEKPLFENSDSQF